MRKILILVTLSLLALVASEKNTTDSLVVALTRIINDELGRKTLVLLTHAMFNKIAHNISLPFV
jgi:hypothetical protein